MTERQYRGEKRRTPRAAWFALGLAALALPASGGCTSDPVAEAPGRVCGLQIWHKPASVDAHVEIVGDWNDWKRPGLIAEVRPDGWIASAIDAAPGEHAYAIIEDGVWLTDTQVPLTAFHEGKEVALAIAEDCERPALKVEGVESTPDGHGVVKASFLAARGGAALDPAAVTVTSRSGAALAVTASDPATGTLRLEASGLKRGKYTFSIKARDANGAESEEAIATVWIEAHAWDPRDAIVYQVVLDRFRGDAGPLTQPALPSERAGGTLKGLRAAIEAGDIEALGVNTLWLSPLYQNPEGEFPGTDGHAYTSYHGYWPIASRALDARVASEEELDRFMQVRPDRAGPYGVSPGRGDEGPALLVAPPDFLSDPALAAVLRALPGARLVGGAVRDTLAGRPVADVDLAVPDPPDAVVQALQAAGLKHAPTGLQHGTVTAISDHRGFEVTTLRRDVATDGRHAEVAWTDDWREDAARRDFSINAMSMRPDGAVFDYFGGLADLRAGRVRFVGDAAARIAEDYLRVLRYFRFQARYGRVPPDGVTRAALAAAAGALGRLSVERVWSELKRILAIPDPVGAVALMAELGVLEAVLPGPSDVAALGRLVAAGGPADRLLRLHVLHRPRSAAGLAAHYKLSGAEAATLEGLAGPPPDPGWNDDDLRRALAGTPGEMLVLRAWAAEAERPGAEVPGAAWATLRGRIGAMPRPRFPLQGRDVVALGHEGPEVGRRLAAARAWWMAGGCVADARACRAWLAGLPAPSPTGRGPG